MIGKSSIEQLSNWFRRAQLKVHNFVEAYPTVSKYWIVTGLISIGIASVSTVLSDQSTRDDVVSPLLIGVITLFTISLTVTIMGIQVATNRYSHRADSTVTQKWIMYLHFLPHLLAIMLGILLISTGTYAYWVFYLRLWYLSINSKHISVSSMAPPVTVSGYDGSNLAQQGRLGLYRQRRRRSER